MTKTLLGLLKRLDPALLTVIVSMVLLIAAYLALELGLVQP